MPGWINASHLHEGSLPIRDILDRSIYYPACRLDPDPVLGLVGNFHSFIYVDYAVGREQLCQDLLPVVSYEVEACREVDASECALGEVTRMELERGDGDPNGFQHMRKPPFAVWSIQRCVFPLSIGHPFERFSLLYIGGEGVATFQSLYYAMRLLPQSSRSFSPGMRLD